MPPDLNIDEPKQPIVFAGTSKNVSVRLKGSAASVSGLASLTIIGKAVQIPARSLSAPFDQTVLVPRREAAVMVEATDSKGNRRSISVPVIYPGGESSKPVRMSGERFAVVIGVSRLTAGTGAPPPLRAAA